MLDRAKFIHLLSAVCEIYNKELSTLAINLYYETLKDYSTEQINHAFNVIVRTNKYNCLPKPAEIIEVIEGKEDDRALLAWESVIKAIRKYDSYKSVEFEDKTIHMCIENLGGWLWLCEQTKDDLKFIMKDFIKMYKAFEKNPRETPKKLLGYIEQQNLKNNHPEDIPKTVFIPFKKLCVKPKELIKR